MMLHDRFSRRLRLAARLIAAAMAVVLFTMLWGHPLSFMVFLGLAVPLLVLGMLVYFGALLSLPTGMDHISDEEKTR